MRINKRLHHAISKYSKPLCTKSCSCDVFGGLNTNFTSSHKVETSSNLSYCIFLTQFQESITMHHQKSYFYLIITEILYAHLYRNINVKYEYKRFIFSLFGQINNLLNHYIYKRYIFMRSSMVLEIKVAYPFLIFVVVVVVILNLNLSQAYLE